VIGRGNHLFGNISDYRKLRLVETKRFATGIVILELEPAA